MKKAIIALAVLAVFVCGCVGQQAVPTTTGGQGTSAKSDITIENFAFSPAETQILYGVTVVWTNKDAATHRIVADDGSFDSGDLAQGATFAHTFSKMGTYAYHCSIHPSMKGKITVG